MKIYAIAFVIASLAAEPKLVTLQADKLTARQALADLAKQTGIVVEERLGETGPTFPLNLRAVSFWPSLDAIARAANARIDLYPREGRLNLLPRPAGYVDPPVCYDGPFRIALKRITASRDLESSTSAYVATLEVAWEPTLLPLLLETNPRNLTVQDSSKKSLPIQPEGSVTAPVDGRFALSFDIALPSVPRTVQRLGLIEGKLLAIAPSKMLTFTFDGVDKIETLPAIRKEDGVTCKLVKATLRDERWTFQIALDYPPGSLSLESYQSWVVNNEISLEGGDRKRLTSDGYAIDSLTPRRAVLSYHFLDPAKKLDKKTNVKLIYKAPASLIEVPFTFSYRDVVLP